MILKGAWFLLGFAIAQIANGNQLIGGIFLMAAGAWGLWGNLR
jgi:hypothetical protein